MGSLTVLRKSKNKKDTWRFIKVNWALSFRFIGTSVRHRRSSGVTVRLEWADQKIPYEFPR